MWHHVQLKEAQFDTQKPHERYMTQLVPVKAIKMLKYDFL